MLLGSLGRCPRGRTVWIESSHGEQLSAFYSAVDLGGQLVDEPQHPTLRVRAPFRNLDPQNLAGPGARGEDRVQATHLGVPEPQRPGYVVHCVESWDEPTPAWAMVSLAATARRWRSVIDPIVLFSDIATDARNLRTRV